METTDTPRGVDQRLANLLYNWIEEQLTAGGVLASRRF